VNLAKECGALCATPLIINVLANDTGVSGGTVAVTSPATLGTATFPILG
jgi:hypothetical protein